MHSADVSGRHHFVLSSLRGLDLWPPNDKRLEIIRPLYLPSQEFGYLGCRVACGIQFSTQNLECVFSSSLLCENANSEDSIRRLRSEIDIDIVRCALHLPASLAKTQAKQELVSANLFVEL